MPTLQLYDQLLRFPLFQGLNRGEMMDVAGFTRFDFVKVKAGDEVLQEGEQCSQLVFLIKGALTTETWADDRSYSFVETLSSPWLLQPEVLFGLRARIHQHVWAASEVQLITLSKKEVFRLLSHFEVIRLNLLNGLATSLQRHSGAAWKPAPKDARGRIVRFFLQHVAYPAGPKTVNIYMAQLARCTGESQRSSSAAIHEMSREGLVELHRGSIDIPFMERLLM